MSLEAEKSILGAVFLDNESYYKADIKPQDFENFYHQNIWSMMQELADNDTAIDLVTITSLAKEKGLLEKSGGIQYFSELVDFVPTAANVSYYVNTVKKSAAKRMVRDLGKQLQECNSEQDALELVESTLYNFTETSDAVSLGDMARKSIKIYEQRHSLDGKLGGVSYGYSWLDKKTGGILPGQLIIFAGRPSMGKTAFALNVVSRSKAKVYFASLETSKQSITDRLFAQAAKVDLTKIKTGRFNEQDFPVMVHTAALLQESGVYIDDTAALSVTQLKQRARRHKIKHGLDFIVVDYLQLMTAKSDNRFQEVSLISRQLKQLAKEVAPVIALCQLSRNGAGDRAQVEHLRESGQIEQDADLIIFPYRESANCEECKAKNEDCGKGHFNLADVTIAKQKDGSLGRQDFYWSGRYQSFDEVYKD